MRIPIKITKAAPNKCIPKDNTGFTSTKHPRQSSRAVPKGGLSDLPLEVGQGQVALRKGELEGPPASYSARRDWRAASFARDTLKSEPLAQVIPGRFRATKHPRQSSRTVPKGDLSDLPLEVGQGQVVLRKGELEGLPGFVLGQARLEGGFVCLGHLSKRTR